MPGLEDAAIQAAETLQTAHIERHPDTAHDLAPETAAESKQPVNLDPDADAVSDEVDEDEIPVSLLRPTPRKPQMPPLPDLRFEQSYLASIKDAQGWKGVAFITMRDQVRHYIAFCNDDGEKRAGGAAVDDDEYSRLTTSQQVMMPLIQGLTWTLLVSGWRHFNRGTKFSGQTVGARIRRWWWGKCEEFGVSPGRWLMPGRRQRLEDSWEKRRVRFG